MSLIRFTVSRENVTPVVYPFGIKYWLVEEVTKGDDVLYTFHADVIEPSIIYRYWPSCQDVLTIDSHLQPSVMCKRFPEGNELGIVRVRFNYPANIPVSDIPYPRMVNYNSGGGKGYKTWFICADSVHHVLEKYPLAWCVEVLAEGLACA